MTKINIQNNSLVAYSNYVELQNKISMRRFLSLIISYFILAFSSSATAQIVPDGTLPENSVVNDRLEITGGTTAGNNLFHSFEEFSLRTGETAFFNHDLAIENIISRVTGSSVSAIDGLIRSLGDANLFLINPNGIVFGENAALDVGGSFIGSTANSIQFADDSEFSAINSSSEPLLTVSIPVGLQYGNNAGNITVEGVGNNLSIDPETFTVERSDRPVGLAVDRGNTLALIGGDVFLPGGNLTAAEGKIVIASVANSGLVRLTPDDLGWNFNYDSINNFGEINLSQAASIEVSGNSGGAVNVRGNTIRIQDGSAILADTLGDGSGRVLEILATDSIELIGSATNNSFPTRLSTDVDLNGTGNGGNLSLDTNYLLVADGAQVISGTFGLGDAGNLTITATEIEVIGKSFDSEFPTGLFTQADIGETGSGGDLSINTDYLLVADGAQISTTTFGSGNAGNLNIVASEIELIGTSERAESGLFVSTQGSGNGGNLDLVADYLLVAGGAEISTTTFIGTGNAGNLNIVATEIELIGGAAGFGSSGLFANVQFREIDGVVFEASGKGGNINLENSRLLITGGAQIAAFTNSLGNAGSIEISSQEIEIGEISSGGAPSAIFAIATRNIGNGGNITITTTNLHLNAGGQIATSTSGMGNGGDLAVFASDSILLQGTSDNGSSGLFASAIEGNGSGGNIIVETDFLFLLDGATISASNFPSSPNSPFSTGGGAAGNVDIIATEIVLDREASITADTFSGDRGNLNIQTDLLLLRQGSNISTNAQGTATGGNITIDASEGFLIAIPQENSDITANAVFGDGGRVDILALEIFGIQPRNSLTPFSDLTASSEFGIAGDITLNTQDLNPVEDLAKLPNTVTPPELAQGCEIPGDNNNSNFVNVGRGGLNPQSNDVLGSDELIGDTRLPRQWKNSENTNEIVEAQSWIVDREGRVVLVANKNHESWLSGCRFN